MSSEEVAVKVVQNLMFLRPNWGWAPNFFVRIYKSTPLSTYWPSLVEIPFSGLLSMLTK